MDQERMPADYDRQKEVMIGEIKQMLQDMQATFERHNEKLNLANLMEMKQSLEKTLRDLEERVDR